MSSTRIWLRASRQTRSSLSTMMPLGPFAKLPQEILEELSMEKNNMIGLESLLAKGMWGHKAKS